MNNYPKKVPDTFRDNFEVDSDDLGFPLHSANYGTNFFNNMNNDEFSFNNGLSYSQSDLFSKMNKSATKTEFMLENRSLFKDEELKTTRSGVVYDTPKAETIIDNPGIYEPFLDFFSSRKFQSIIKTPIGRQSKHERSTWMEDIKTDGLNHLFGGLDERTSRSGRVFSKKYDKKESFAEETEFDKETITNLKKCLREESLKRTVDKIDTKSIALVNSNKEFTLDLTKKTTCPVSYQPKHDKIGNYADDYMLGSRWDDCSPCASKQGVLTRLSPLKPKKKTTCPVSYQPKNEEVGNYDHDYSLGVRWEDCAPCDYNQLKSSNHRAQPCGSNYDNKNITSFRAFEENHGQWSRKFEFNPSAGECFVNHPGVRLRLYEECMNPNEAFSKSPKKIKLSSLKKEIIKKYVCNYKGCAQKFDRVDLLKRHEKIHCKDKNFKCPICDYMCNRKDNLDNHMRIHFHAKPYICPYAVYNKAQNTWEPCIYAAARQDDLTKHCIGTGVCHLKEFSSKDEKDYKNHGFPVPAKIMNGKKDKMFKLRDSNVKLSEPLYREYVNQSADFMYVIELKIMKKWTAVWNAAKKKRDEKAQKMLEKKWIPNLMQGKNYDKIKLKTFDDPQFEFCDTVLELNRLDVSRLFKNYQLGDKVKDTHKNPDIRGWGPKMTNDWKRAVDSDIKRRLQYR